MKIELSGHYGYGRLIKSALPCIAMMAVTSLYTIADGLFISNFAGSTAFAAINIIYPAISIIAVLGLMFGTGGSALVAKTLGEGDKERASALFTMLVRVSFVLGLVLSVAFFFLMEPIVLLLGAEGAKMVDDAVLYGRILTLALPLNIMQMLFQPLYMVAERPMVGTRVSVVCGLANVGLDALFVVGFGWGLAGAAVATSVTISIGGIFPLVWFRSKKNSTHLRFVRTRTDWRAIGKSCTNGLSEYVGNIALNIVGICYNLQLMKYIGEDGVSAYGIIMYVGFLFASVFIGYDLAVSQVVSYNYGAGNKQELRSLLKKSAFLIGVCGLVMTALSELTAGPVARFFVGYDKELCDLTVHATRIYMLSFLICGLNMFTSAWFTALNNGVISALAAFTRTLVFELSAVFILPLIFGIEGIWLSVIAAEILAFVLAVSLIMGLRKKYGY